MLGKNNSVLSKRKRGYFPTGAPRSSSQRRKREGK
jgi:hypothetical protein